MRQVSGIVLLGILTVVSWFSLGGSAFSADLKARFDVPAEPMDRALRDFALQSNCNISFEPSLVTGLRAPAVKGEYSRSEALSILLTGTALKAVTVNSNTIEVVERGAETDLERKTADKRDLEEIVVTGTHIRGVGSASPVTEIGREEIDRSGYTSLADLMLSVPQMFGGGINPATGANNSQVNSRFADNPTGASAPNLRGLGPGSTLALVDGHRMATGLTGGGADITSIPIDAIDRVEIVTDSASAIYGSDAVAGVVNIILKRDYQGAKTSLSYGYAPEEGGAQKRASQLYGTSWNGGNVMLAYEHMQEDAVDAKDREFTATTAEPNSLLPATKSNSVTLSVRQDVGRASAFIDGLYIARDANRYLAAYSGYLEPFAYPTTLRKFAVATGVDFSLWRDWKASVFITDAEDKTLENVVMLTSPVTQENAEKSLGTLRGIEASANGIVAKLPAGPVRLAFGVGYRRESFSNALGVSFDTLVNSGAGERNIRYGFGEISLPLLGPSEHSGVDVLALTVSGRSERYSDFGSKTVPKIGLVYAPTSSLKFRSTWGKAFKAPNLYDANAVQKIVALNLPDPAAAGGGSLTLIRAGGNPALRPESAESWSVGVDYSGLQDNRLRVATTLFDIKYKNRNSQIGNVFAALTDPLNAFFVTPSPSASFAQSVIDQYPPSDVLNFTGRPYALGDVAAIVDSRLRNVASQIARGADLSINYRVDAKASSTLFFLNGTYLDLKQINTPQSPTQTLSGLAFYPPKYRARTGVTWKPALWALTGIVNYLPRETNTQVSPAESVGSWTTIDASVRYAPTLKGIWGGLNFNLAALNLLNKNPPYVLSIVQGLNFDSSNVSPLGRLITLQVSKEW